MTEQHDRDELVELMSRYANMPDTQNWDELPRSVLCDEFTGDFSLGGPVMTFSRDAWCQQMKQVFTGWAATHHAITNHRIAIDGDRATIRAHIRRRALGSPRGRGRRTELLVGRRLLRRRRRANPRRAGG
jgi:SnoaL-like domain